jgi:hypothetical protein
MRPVAVQKYRVKTPWGTTMAMRCIACIEPAIIKKSYITSARGLRKKPIRGLSLHDCDVAEDPKFVR